MQELVKGIPKKSFKTTEVVDTEKLNEWEQQVYDLSEEDWCNVEQEALSVFGAKSWNLVNWRYCWKCKSVRAPRTHHCSACSRCVLRFDHHCYWVGSCVGLRSHKHFLMFVFYAGLGCTVVSLSMLHKNFIASKASTTSEFEWYSQDGLALCLSSLVALMLTTLYGYHIKLICYNESSLEVQNLKQFNPFTRPSKLKNL